MGTSNSKKYDPTDDAGALTNGDFTCNIDIKKYQELKRKYGLSKNQNPFEILPKYGISSDEINSVYLPYNW